MTVTVRIELREQDGRRLNRVCGPRTGVTRQSWIAEAVREKLEREIANTSVKVETT